MQNKNKTTFLFDYSVRESRLLGFAPTKRLDQLQVPATNEEIKNILNNNEDLSGRLEKLKKLEREKRATIGDSKEKIKLLKKAYEEKHEIPIADTAIEKIVHELIEAHDKEVGTAIQIRSDGWKTKEDDWGGWDEFENEKDTYHDEGEFILVHASSSAAKLVLKHHESAGGQVNQEEISKVFKDAGFEVDSATYKKDEIPTAKPFSKVIPEGWKINVPVKEGNSVPETAKQTKAVPAPSTERLLSDNAENKKLLDKVIGGGEKVANGATNYELKRTMRLRDENGRIKGSVSGDIKIEKTEAGKFAQFGANRVWGKIVGVDEWVALSGKNGRSWNTKEAGSKKSASSVERNFFNDPSETNRRKFSSVEFAKKVNASGLAEPEKTALIEAAIKLDVTVTNRRITESGKNRGVFLEKQAK